MGIKKRKLLIYLPILVCILIICGIAIWIFLPRIEYALVCRSNSSSEFCQNIHCGLTGGKWGQVSGGFASKKACLHRYPDAGKLCQSSSECKGGCLPGGNPSNEGYCKEDDGPYPNVCHESYTIEDLKAGKTLDCAIE